MMIIFGKHSVKAALSVARDGVKKIYAEQGKNPFFTFGKIAEGVPFEIASKQKLDNLSKNGNHQGFVAELRKFPVKGERELKSDLEKIERGLIVIADGILDTRNLGAIIRSLSAAGGFGIVIPEDRSAPISGATVHASAGSVFLVNVYHVKNLVRAIEYMKESGFWTFGLDLNSKTNLLNHKFPVKTAIAIGGEEKGLRRIVRRSCDELLKIPQENRVESLNASVAAALAIYEYARVHQFKG